MVLLWPVLPVILVGFAPQSPGNPAQRANTQAMVSRAAAAVPLLAIEDEAARIRQSKQYFAEAKAASDADGGKLWGRPLYGPMIFLDTETRTIYANQPDPEHRLTEKNGVYISKVGPEFPTGNTSTRFGGTTWTTIPFDNMPDTRIARARLMMHESFHRIQNDLGLPPGQARNVHLDDKDGRTWLRLEWRALSVALVSWGPERSQAIRDALTFRAYRRSLYPDAAREEDRMEVHEGLAEYTGIALDGLDNQSNRWFMAGRLKVDAQRPSYPYSFAYETGPAYGLLLDMGSQDWRKGLTPASSLSGLLAAAEHFQAPDPLESAAVERANAYRPADIFTSEDKREREREHAIAEYRRILVTGPVLELPLAHMNFSFNPNEVVPLGDEGNVYPTTTISDTWGTIEAQKGARINKTFSAAYVSAPTSADHLAGDGWKLSLKPGWKVVPGEKPGSFKVARMP
ncbi:MAG TPA: hypothetical protein VFA07_03690 [Chthonomonadaceae bacterium]|nr:hypothetical protein [Chthonomonadaceae bacterium]